MNKLRNKILKMDALISSGHLELCAKNLLIFAKDIDQFAKEKKYDYILERCEDVEEWSKKAIKDAEKIRRDTISNKKQ